MAADGRRWSLSLEADGSRADVAVMRALVAQGVAVTRAAVQRAFAAGLVVTGGVPMRPSTVLFKPMQVDVELLAVTPLVAEPESIPLVIVHEDDDIVVIDKPAGMPVHAGPGHTHGTVVNAILGHLGVGADALPVLAGNDATRPGIVHRLDKDTSGLLVVAKHAAAQEHLAAQFRTHSLGRAYLGIVDGVPRWTARHIETGHARDPADRRRFFGDGGGRTALTDATLDAPLHAAAIVRFTLRTGRTHQIRMHARALGHPILGDVLYGHRPADPRVAAAIAGLGRHALHAAHLSLQHPDGRTLAWTSALPPQLAAIVAALAV